jgi:hypothetical protein
VTTDRRALATARFRRGARAAGADRRVDLGDAGGVPFGDCRVDVASGGVCDFVDLPAFANITVTVDYRAAEGTYAGDLAVYVSTSGDVVNSNNAESAHVETAGMTDLELRVAPTLTGPKSSTLTFPLISVTERRGEGVRRAARSDAARRGHAGQRVGVERDLQRQPRRDL